MGAGETFKELPLLRPGEVADFENDFEMRRRNRHGIGRIRYLRNKTSVLAERCRKPLAGARRPAIQDVAKDALVGLDARRLFVARRALSSRALRERSTSAIASLTLPSARGAIESARNPVRSSDSMYFGSPPASPQRLALRRVARGVGRDLRDQTQHRRIDGIVKVGDRAVVSRRSHDILGQIVRSDRKEIRVEPLDGDRRSRHFDHHAELRLRGKAAPCGAQRSRFLAKIGRAPIASSAGDRHHRQHDLDLRRAPQRGRAPSAGCERRRAGQATA